MKARLRNEVCKTILDGPWPDAPFTIVDRQKEGFPHVEDKTLSVFAGARRLSVNVIMDDRELLRQYVGHRSEAAFTELVRRHLNLVYATALRLMGDSHLAKDVAQSVFIQL